MSMPSRGSDVVKEHSYSYHYSIIFSYVKNIFRKKIKLKGENY